MPDYIQRDGYHVIVWADREDLWPHQILQVVPELVVSHFAVCTSFDSGPLWLSDEERANGWRMIGRFAHSPKITQPNELPFADGYDEYLIFEEYKEINQYETLVNYFRFRPDDAEGDSFREAWIKQFWQQIFALRPTHVIGLGDILFVVTSDESIAAKLRKI